MSPECANSIAMSSSSKPPTLDRRRLDVGGIAAGVITAASWGMTGVWVHLLPPISPLTITAARLAVAALVSFALERRSRSAAERSRHTAAYLVGSLLVGYYLLAVAAFQLAPIAEVALCISSSPLLLLVWNAVRGQRVATCTHVLSRRNTSPRSRRQAFRARRP